eukprot:3137457-Rhodomonas_salina.5
MLPYAASTLVPHTTVVTWYCQLLPKQWCAGTVCCYTCQSYAGTVCRYRENRVMQLSAPTHITRMLILSNCCKSQAYTDTATSVLG